MSPDVVLLITLGWALVSAVGLGRSLPGLVRARGDLAAVPAGQPLARRQGLRNQRLVRFRTTCILANLLVAVLALVSRAGLVPGVASAVIGTTLLCVVPVLLTIDADDHERHQDALEDAAADVLAVVGAAPVPGGRRRTDPPLEPAPPVPP